MKLNDIEKEWYIKEWYNEPQSVRMSNYDANLIACLKFLLEEYKSKYPDDIVDLRSFVNSDSHFWQFCFNSRRLKDKEIQALKDEVIPHIRNFFDLYENTFKY